jgi:putative transposase
MTKKAKKGSKRKKQKTGLNRNILDVGIGNLKDLIKYKVTEAGGFYIEVPTLKVKPSQTCSCCGHQQKKTLSERVHNCSKCGYTDDRDVNAAKVMLDYARGLERASLDAESPRSTLCFSMRQLGAAKHQKHTSQP